MDLAHLASEGDLGPIAKHHAASTCSRSQELIRSAPTHKDVQTRARCDLVSRTRASCADRGRQRTIPGRDSVGHRMVTKDHTCAAAKRDCIGTRCVQRLNPRKTRYPINSERTIPDDQISTRAADDHIIASTRHQGGADRTTTDRVIGRPCIHQNMATRLLAQINKISPRCQITRRAVCREARIKRMIPLAIAVKDNRLCALNLTNRQSVIARATMHDSNRPTAGPIRCVRQIDDIEAIIAKTQEDLIGLKAFGQYA